MSQAVPVPQSDNETETVAGLVSRARAAMASLADADQARRACEANRSAGHQCAEPVSRFP